MENLQGWIKILLVLLGVYVVYKIYKFVTTSPLTVGSAEWWANLFGALKPGSQIEDTTGQAGDNTAQQAQTTTYNASQGAYDVALAAYARNHGYPTSLSAQGTSGWPWASYDAYIEDQSYNFALTGLNGVPYPS